MNSRPKSSWWKTRKNSRITRRRTNRRRNWRTTLRNWKKE